jgi:hypothetical protein
VHVDEWILRRRENIPRHNDIHIAARMIRMEAGVDDERDRLGNILDRTVYQHEEEGATLQQVKAARLTADYDGLYGATTGPWTTDMFVEAVYTGLKQSPVKTAASR